MADQAGRQQVVIHDLDISFLRWVMILVKIALASIPAAIIVSIVYFLIFGILGSLFGPGGGWMMR